jgi:3-hydroxyacyl-[acyl-carrier-protein] dehydratase
VAEKGPIVDLSTLDFEHPIADLQEVRRFNPQRYEMEQVTAIVHEDLQRNICVGFKDITQDEFWVRGHMPGMPLMPGVMMLEAAAQISSYYVQKHDLLKAKIVGFGGLENVRFRGAVVPGDRLVVIAEMTKVRPRRMLVCRFQGVVREGIVVEGTLKGIPLPVDALSSSAANSQDE